MEKLLETNWNRLLRQFKSTGYFIISANRKENTPEENKKKTLELKKELEDKCFKPITVYGGWIEDEGLDTEREVAETSFFVPLFFGNKAFSASQFDATSTHIFYKWVFDLGKKYKQESILYCPPNGKPRYVQTTEKNYGDGPVKPGTHFDRFNKTIHNQKNAPYYTDLTNPKYQGGYNHETGKFMKSPRRITFESLENSFRRVMKLAEGKSQHQNILETPYLLNKETKEEAWDYDNMLRSMKENYDAWADMKDYFDLEEIGNLEEWWQEHYDEKGLASSLEFHKSIINDYQKMKVDYNNSTEHYKRTPIKYIKASNSNMIEIVPDLSEDWLESYNEEEAKEIWADNIFYYLDCVDCSHSEWDDNKLCIYYDNDIFKTGY